MAFFDSDLYPLKLRLLEALDKGKTISFENLRRRISDGEFEELLQDAGHCPKPLLWDNFRQEITDAILNVLEGNIGDENEHFYVSRNGYCLLLAVIMELEQKGLTAGRHRPLQ